MIKNYLKIALRGLAKHRSSSLINILGLSVGMAVALLIGLWINYEYAYDRFLPDYDRVYRLKRHYTLDRVYTSNAISLPLVDLFKNDIPGIQYAAEADWGGSAHSLVVGDKKLYLEGTFVGADFLKIFQFPVIRGNAETALSSPNTIILTASTAEALFGEVNPVGQSIRFDNQQLLTVSGIVEDPPANSTLQFHYLIPFTFMAQNMDYVRQACTDWGMNGFTLFVRLAPQISYEEIAPKIENLLTQNSPKTRDTKQKLSMQAMQNWHLYGKYENGKAVGGYIEYIRIFGLIGFLVLLIACINFINLATARSSHRAKEVGVRKAIGSKRKHLIFQFLTESFFLTSCSFGIALLMVYLALIPFNSLLGSQITMPFRSPSFWLIMVAYISITALIAGSRPAFYLSSFNAVQVLKGALRGERSAVMGRKILIVLQFSCSVALIISTFVIYRQLQHVKDRPTGYDQNRLIMSDWSEDISRNYQALSDELLKSGLIESVARSSSSATNITFFSNIDDWAGKQPGSLSLEVAAITISSSYFETLGMQIKSGRNFRDQLESDANSIILNEAAVEKLNLKEPVGQTITWFENQPATIVGVVENAILGSPFRPVEPTVFTPKGFYASILYRLAPQVKTQEALTQLAPIFERYNPSYPFEYEFVDQAYAQKFQLEVIISKLSGLFAALAIFVSCLGLFGLAAYLAEQRRKEIGIRKILGASAAQIWVLLSRDFLLLVLISCLAAIPIAVYFLENWLEQYNYRITMSPWIFLIASTLAILIAVITVSLQTIRAGKTPPVKSLRTD
ncbi:ABC transporter permease [Flavilitoribacter nigricans]|uniref:ABC transporter permease n=1 Tax=Flavilitoribacter nigricans (strain ATCC 23147 / DSM 23189 / NBRC 102662 / NCIMB 1420 / SS-2) TaxID=1122177 RepID=A0A2D0NEF4_FLAN2|nr:ABC transporter permease [Flavilitoribacter nigricans]PHN06760.1 hypothetical protein CRP01_10740 [Flavilitoribacter nigricans DSM 23189 = NBRC 102662]